ncbi:MAG: flagellar protein FlaG [Desulfuromonadales bacterium]|nr:MAG: flagellar protein FlaG [Desulfuromonadales bacterium]
MSVEITSGMGMVTGSGVPPTAVKPVTQEEERKKAASVELPRTAVKEPSLLGKEKHLDEADKEKRVKEATERINEFLESISYDLQFNVDKDTHRTVVKVLERKSGDVIRQIPSDEMLEIAKALDTLKGLIIRKKA